ncbi:MAG: HDOD domain-containing protein [Methylococcales bacterium]|jgi:HD-like signal output (HDOD) protein|nr:HDOD domain-containing protein [Methylococcales bacterium]MBT7408675.1 HDOD domain-containing protein [Methylococcales bacterium]
MNKVRVIFVDDDPAILEGLRNRLRPMRKAWHMTFSITAKEALNEINNQSYDVIVTDMRMPETDGAELLKKVREQYPGMVRIVLSGQSSKERLLTVLSVAHRFLAKPCDINDLKDAVERGRCLQTCLYDTKIKHLIGSIQRLPALPSLYHTLTSTIEQEHSSLKEISDILEQDVAITARLLQIANSGFFGPARRINQIHDAVVLIGLESIRNLVLCESLFNTLRQSDNTTGFCLAKLQSHSLTVAKIATHLLDKEELKKAAFSAAMLHDIGQIILVSALPDFYKPILELLKKQAMPIHLAEEQIYGFSHAEIGAYLLDLWGLPCSLVEAVAHIHRPKRSGEREFGLIGAIHVADCFADIEETHSTTDSLNFNEELDFDYLSRVGVIDKLPVWQKLAQKIIHPENYGDKNA